tara:strand:+ start:13833 stop:14201 length:369 start_codon:yes stop_codon:yes gene_type:complete
MNSVYKNHKSINRSIEFRGLKAQYIWYLGGGIVVLLILFAGMLLLGIPSLFCVALTLAMGGFMVMKAYMMSKTFGEFGLMKRLAQRQIPKIIRSRSRNIFYKHSNGRDTPNKEKHEEGEKIG